MTPSREGKGSVGDRLARGERIAEPMALVVAHPDDEALGLGSRLHLFERLTLIHLTDGAPHHMGDAHRAGFATREAYAAARSAELDTALEALDCRPERRLAYGFPDQTLVDHLSELTERLARDLRCMAAVFTHAHEGGHPDHDAAALAVARACARLGAAAPSRWEFAGYFGVGGRLHANRFHPDPSAPETAVALTEGDRARKASAFAAHGSQAAVLANFPLRREAWRPAPAYDVSAPPPCGEAHYDRYGWSLTSEIWRERVASTPVRPPTGSAVAANGG